MSAVTTMYSSDNRSLFIYGTHSLTTGETHGSCGRKIIESKNTKQEKKVNFCFWFIFFRKKIPIIERRDVTSCYLPNPIKFPSPPAAPWCNCRIMFCSPLTPPTFKAFYINKFSQNIFKDQYKDTDPSDGERWDPSFEPFVGSVSPSEWGWRSCSCLHLSVNM